jgi:hypothetical protein
VKHKLIEYLNEKRMSNSHPLPPKIKKKQKQKKLLKTVASKVLAYYIPYTRSVVDKPFTCLKIAE